MNAAPSDPKPTAEVTSGVSIFDELQAALIEVSVLRSMVDTLRSERDEARGRAEAAERERDELANWIKRIRGQAESAMASLHGEKLEADLEVTPPTAK